MITLLTKMDQNNIITGAVRLNRIGKKYPLMKRQDPGFKDFWALKDVSLSVFKGRVFGIIGRNGAGKTTLLNIIAGTLTPTEGQVSVDCRVSGLFNIGVGFQEELTGRENIFLNGAIIGATKKELIDKIDSIIEFSELGNFINMPLGSYSQGMRLRLGFSVIANLDFDILVIDEVLAVGDALFQSKCFERLMDFKREGRILIITSQDMGMIERLCDEVIVVDHGHIVFQGEPVQAIDKYRALLNTERFFVGPSKIHNEMVRDTKKWAEDMHDWGKRFGTKEVVIDSVEFINRFGFRCDGIKTQDPLKIKVNFTAKNRVKDLHFGVAIFREDGIYCYGPNTEFDNYHMKELKQGKGYFTLTYKNVLLAPGAYKVSVAIWDKNERIAFDYHNAFYGLRVTGREVNNGQLLNMPYKVTPLKTNFQKSESSTVKLFDPTGRENNIFITNQPLKILVNTVNDNQGYRYLKIFREDGVYCQGIPLTNASFNVFFPRMSLLPGHYNISIDDGSYHSAFHMVFNKNDHGTIYLEHDWRWRLP